MISQAEVGDWLAAYREAWLLRDPGRIVALFTDEASYREKRFAPPAAGTEGIRRYWEDNVVRNERDVAFAVEQVAVTGDQAFVHWRASFRWLPTADTLELDAIFRLSFSADRNAAGLRRASALEEWIEHRARPA